MKSLQLFKHLKPNYCCNLRTLKIFNLNTFKLKQYCTGFFVNFYEASIVNTRS